MTTAAINRGRLKRTIGPASQPVSVADAKKQLEISSSDTVHDAQLTELIEASREQFEDDTGLITTQQTFELRLDMFPLGKEVIRLPVRPVASVSSVTYTDGTNDEATLAGTVYQLDSRGRELFLKYDQEWPAIESQSESVVITFVAGYATAAAVPRLIKRAIALQVGKWFQDRDMMTSENFQHDRAYERIVKRLMRTSYP